MKGKFDALYCDLWPKVSKTEYSRPVYCSQLYSKGSHKPEGEPSEDVVGSYYQVELLFQSCDSIPENIPNNTTSSPDGSYLHVSKKKSISRKQRLNFDF